MISTKKRILVIAPVLAQSTDIKAIANSLAFLAGEYELDYIDPLSQYRDASPAEFYLQWQKKLSEAINSYEVFLGFSFGGVILQQCFPIFASAQKTIMLFSTPSFADETLVQKLGEVIRLCKENQVQAALLQLHHYVACKPGPANFKLDDSSAAARRLILGLERVLSSDSRAILHTTEVRYWHFIGAQSNLVNLQNVVVAKRGRLCVIPNAGMRVLQDNPQHCQALIWQRLNGDAQDHI
ncbi:hypothetical protein [Legionella septentrionalis]|uniref:Alpha/beta hydrolase n=1 Tax=Legionella septentrionalis TaxID=2498109 RepID=A0A3S0XHG5_9GAMM|nr:hypothetical protein [Legionella septentrionalis]RUQ90061.1 hypothetical protein EKM59_02690 [Legionella septentrionalis]